MKHADIEPAIGRIQAAGPVIEPRALTYLATSPALVAYGGASSKIDAPRFHQIAAMTYGWMPRVVRLDPLQVEPTLRALKRAKDAKRPVLGLGDLEAVARCLYSLVGASKILHFMNPKVFPIWDSYIARLRGGPGADPENRDEYLAYLMTCTRLLKSQDLRTFVSGFRPPTALA
jgi:hypothetical protein